MSGRSLRRWFLVGLAAAVLASVVTGTVLVAGARSQTALKPVTLILHWMPQSQFAGYYMALEKGFYRDRGLDVTILRGGPDRDPVEYLTTGKADFATLFLTGALIARDQGAPIVHIAQIVNSSNLMLIARRGAGISSIEDLQGRRVSLWGPQFSTAFEACFKANSVQPVAVPQYYTVNLFLRRGVDACSAMAYNEYQTLVQSGMNDEEMTKIYMRDMGFDFPEDGIYCLDETLAGDPETCKAFVAATLEGWRYAGDHSDEALEIVMARAREVHVPTNLLHQRWMLETILDSILPEPGDPWRMGELLPDAYEEVVATLQEQSVVLPGAAAYRQFHPVDLLPVDQ
jgi:NitT/TauT family transport system substrate-binding protein